MTERPSAGCRPPAWNCGTGDARLAAHTHLLGAARPSRHGVSQLEQRVGGGAPHDACRSGPAKQRQQSACRRWSPVAPQRLQHWEDQAVAVGKPGRAHPGHTPHVLATFSRQLQLNTQHEEQCILYSPSPIMPSRSSLLSMLRKFSTSLAHRRSRCASQYASHLRCRTRGAGKQHRIDRAGLPETQRAVRRSSAAWCLLVHVRRSSSPPDDNERPALRALAFITTPKSSSTQAVAQQQRQRWENAVRQHAAGDTGTAHQHQLHPAQLLAPAATMKLQPSCQPGC